MGLVGTFCNCINLNNGSKSLLLYNIHFIVQIRGHQTFCKASGSEYFGLAGKQALAPIQFHLAAQRQPQATHKLNKCHWVSMKVPWWLSWQRIRLQCGRPGFTPWVGKIPWRREGLPTPVFWPGEFHGLYSPPGRRELDTTE